MRDTVHAWRRLLTFVLIGVVVASAATAPAAAGDVVLEWNEIAQRTVAAVNPLIQSRSMGMVQAAVADAVGAVVGEYEPIVSRPTAAAGASAAAAAVAAAHAVLVALHPAAAEALDRARATSLETVADDARKDEGVRVGKEAAAAVLEARASDGWNGTASYTPANLPGRWVPTPPALAPALVPHWGRMKPFALDRADRFRAAPPPAHDSDAYLRDLREVVEVGGVSSTKRPAEITNAARFWIISGMQGWNPVARQASVARRLTLAQNARLLALLNVAMADALIACWDSKYAYDTWRPVTVIRAGGAGMAPYAGWTPLIPTPPFPAYPSGHACAAGAAGVVLERFLGPSGHAITLTSATAPGVSFTYDGFQAIADQIDEARVCGGIHVRHDQTAGRELGRRVGDHVCRTSARLLGGGPADCRP